MHTQNHISSKAKNHRHVAQTRALYPESSSSLYPGLTDSPPPVLWSPGTEVSSLPVPVSPSGGPPASNPSPFKGFNLESIKSMVDRMGGIQGIVDNMNKMQKLFASFQQMAPMLKLLFNSFSGKNPSPQVQMKEKSSYPRRKRNRSKRISSPKKFKSH